MLFAALAACGKKADQPPPGPPTVTVAPPLVRRIVDWDDYVGRFEATSRAEVRPRVSGQLATVAFRDGQFVHPGDLLFIIDPRPYEAAAAQARADVTKARANLALGQSNFARLKQLLAGNAASREEFDTAQATLGQNQADLASSQATLQARLLDLSFTRVTAPAAGRASDRRLTVGNYVTAGTTPLTTIVSINPIYFTFEGGEGEYLKYQRQNRAGTRPSSRVSPNPVDIRLQDEPSYRWHGRMDFVDNELDQSSGTIRGRAVVNNPDGFLTPGMFGHMRLLGSGAYDGLLVPQSSVVTDQTRKQIMVLGPDNKIVARNVVEGPVVEGLQVIRSGLKPGDQVVIEGVGRVKPGAPVNGKAGKIVPPAPGTSPDVGALAAPPASSSTAVHGR